MKTEAETGGRRPQAQGRLEPPEAGRGRKDPPLEPLEGAQTWNTLTSDVWSPGLGEDECLWFKSLDLQLFVTPAPETDTRSKNPIPVNWAKNGVHSPH